MDPITLGIIAGGSLLAGGLMKNIGANKQAVEAERQLERFKPYAAQQRSMFDTGWGDIMNSAKGLSTYQGDLTKYTQAEETAKANMMQSSGATRIAGEQVARDQASRATSDAMAMARRAGGSSSDIMTAALLGQQQESAAQGDISARVGQQLFTQAQQGKQDYLGQLGITAAAKAQQEGLMFQSQSAKQQALLGLQQQQLQNRLGLEDALFQQKSAKAGELANAKAAVYSGWGDVGNTIGSGLLAMSFQDMKMKGLGTGDKTTTG